MLKVSYSCNKYKRSEKEDIQHIPGWVLVSRLVDSCSGTCQKRLQIHFYFFGEEGVLDTSDGLKRKKEAHCADGVGLVKRKNQRAKNMPARRLKASDAIFTAWSS